MARIPVIPTNIVVHLGNPDSNAENLTVPFRDYIKNVASSEIFSTWPEESIKANVLWLFAIIIRVVTERHSSINEIIDSELNIVVKLSDVENYKQLKSVSNNLIVRISSNILTSVYNGNSKIIAKAIKYVHSNYASKITLNDIEDNLHVNPSYFSSLFKQEMNISFIGYINQVKIEYACTFLTDSIHSIIDIALELGFDDQSYFTKVFKKQCGMTPKEYRLNNKKK